MQMSVCIYLDSYILILMGQPNHSPSFYVSSHNEMTGQSHTHTHTHTNNLNIFLLLGVIFLFSVIPSVKKVKNKKYFKHDIFLYGPKYNTEYNTIDWSYPESQKWHVNTLILIGVISDPPMEECGVQSLVHLRVK